MGRPPGLAARHLHAATTAARAGREADAWRHWDAARAAAGRLSDRYHHPWTVFGGSNVKLHAVSIAADLSKAAEAPSRAEDIDPEEIPSTQRRGRLGVGLAGGSHHRPPYPAILPWLRPAYQTS